MFSKFELIGGGIAVGLMALTIFLLQAETSIENLYGAQEAAVIESDVVVVPSDAENERQAQAAALLEASNGLNKMERMVIDDIKIGTGPEVKDGDVVSVHYAGRLQDGTEFDNSKTRGAAFEFKVGGGQVIAGWEEGLLGMQVGGERILVIPPKKAYGKNGIGPIPGNATLVFSIELLEIK